MSLHDAARAAGGHPRRWTRELIVHELRAHAAVGRVSIKQLPDVLVAAIYNHFGSIGKARAAAKIEAPPRRAR